MIQRHTPTFNEHAHNLIRALLKRTPIVGRKLLNRYNRIILRHRQAVDARAYFGSVFYNVSIKDKISRYIFNYGMWEPNISCAFESMVKPGDLVVDVGANIGYYSLLSSSLVGPKGRVVAIEASPRTFRQLSENLKRNGAKNVRAVNVAVSDKAERITLYGGPEANRGTTSTLPNAGLTAEAVIDALPLTDILTPEERAVAKLIKIDIEGGELPLLRQLAATLDWYNPDLQILAEMTPGWAGRAQLEAVFQKYLAAGFTAFAIENCYTDKYYFEWRRPEPMQKVTSLPDQQVDILFTRNT